MQIKIDTYICIYNIKTSYAKMYELIPSVSTCTTDQSNN